MFKKIEIKRICISFFLIIIAIGIGNAQIVNPDGSFSYTYPIAIPPGTGGMAPTLSLSYNSNNGNGMCGVGWSFGSFSTIGRDRTYPVTFNDTTDHFTFDGQRLIPDTTTPLLFHTENENFSHIRAIKTTDNTRILYWEVMMKNGTKMYYGYTSSDHTLSDDGYIKAISQGEYALVWCLNKVIDVSGNYYIVKYYEDVVNGDYYPINITYTKGIEILKYNSIDFYYENCVSYGNQFIPTLVEWNERLKWITVKTNNNLLRKYQLSYKEFQSPFNCILESITEYGADGNCPVYGNTSDNGLPRVSYSYFPTGTSYPPTTFEWNSDKIELYPYTDYKSNFYSGSYYTTGDFDGDGISELLNYKTNSSAGVDVWLSDIVEKQVVSVPLDHRTDLFVQPTPGPTPYPGQPTAVPIMAAPKLLTGDFNADGTTDIMTITNKTSFRIYDVNNGQIEDLPSYENLTFHESCDFYTGDFNGDGTTDILTWKNDNELWINPIINGQVQGSTDHKTNFRTNAQIHIGDFNGDGTSDILAWRNNEEIWINLVVDGQLQPCCYHVQVFHSGCALYLGDFNGDGTTDIITRRADSGEMWINFIQNGQVQPYSYNNIVGDSGLTYIIPYDSDGDGADDILYWTFDGELIFIDVVHGALFPSGCTRTSFHESFDGIIPLNLDGNGIPELLFYERSSGQYYLDTLKIEHSARIKSIRNPQGGTINISYKTAALSDGAIKPIDLSSFGIPNNSQRIIVSSWAVSDGYNNNYTTTYEYENGRIITGKKDVRKNLGFEYITITNPTGTKIRTKYYQDTSYTGMPQITETIGKDNKVYKEAEIGYVKQIIQNATSNYAEVKSIFKTDEWVREWVDGDHSQTPTEMRTEYIGYTKLGIIPPYKELYDNVLKIINYGDTETENDDYYVCTEYSHNLMLNDPDKYIIVPTKSEKYCYDELSGEYKLAQRIISYYDYSTSYGYIGLKGHLTRQQEYIDDNSYVSIENEYDQWGNLIKIKDGRACNNEYNEWTKKTEYDNAYHAYGTKKYTYTGRLDIPWYVETVNYDNLMRPIQTTDINGLTEFKTYDEFHREIKLDIPDNSEYATTITEYINAVLYQDGTIQTPSGTIKKMKIDDNVYSETVQYIDGMGRQIQIKAKKDLHNWITKDYIYHDESIDGETYLSYLTNTKEYSSPQPGATTEQNVYDNIGRAIKHINHDGTFGRTIYKKRKVININALNHATEDETFGNIAINRVYDGTYPSDDPIFPAPISMVTNTSRWNGTIITDDTGNSVITRVDLLGRKIESNDPSLGFWTYKYDANGNLLEQIDAKAQKIEVTYDIMNRVIQRKYPNNDKIIYNYDYGGSAAGALGKLTSVTFPGGSEIFEYSSLGRVKKITKTIGTESRVFTYTYYPSGKPKTELLPDNEKLYYIYNESGALKQLHGIKDNVRKDYVLDVGYNTIGKLLSIIYGNNTTTQYSYYDDFTSDPSNENRTHSYRLRSIQVQNNVGKYLANTTYEYNACDAIMKKAFTDDYEGDFTEQYTYDDMNRLLSAYSERLYGTKNYQYYANNNIKEKEGMKYFYNASVEIEDNVYRLLPYSVSEIKNSDDETIMSYEYDKNGNLEHAQGFSKITVRAKTDNPQLGSRMELWLNNKQVMSWLIIDTEYDDYSWNGYWDGNSDIYVVFANNQNSQVKLFIESIKVNNVLFLPADGKYDQGTYPDYCFNGEDIIDGTSELVQEGALRFRNITAQPISRTIMYNYENLMTSISDNGNIFQYVYNHAGKRIKKIENGKTTLYFGNSYEEIWEGPIQKQIVKYYYTDMGKAAQRTTDISTGTSILSYVHTDHLNSAVRLSDESGNPILSMAYGPFGEIVYVSGGTDYNYMYTGQEHDTGSGLYYYGARYYDPLIGRFIQPDSALNGLNRYAYCNNNPIIYNDPTGNFLFWSFNSRGGSFGVWLGIFYFGVSWSWDGKSVGLIGGLGVYIGPENFFRLGVSVSFTAGYNTTASISTSLSALGGSISMAYSLNFTHMYYSGFSITASYDIIWYSYNASVMFTPLGATASGGWSWGVSGSCDVYQDKKKTDAPHVINIGTSFANLSWDDPSDAGASKLLRFETLVGGIWLGVDHFEFYTCFFGFTLTSKYQNQWSTAAGVREYNKGADGNWVASEWKKPDSKFGIMRFWGNFAGPNWTSGKVSGQEGSLDSIEGGPDAVIARLYGLGHSTSRSDYGGRVHDSECMMARAMNPNDCFAESGPNVNLIHYSQSVNGDPAATPWEQTTSFLMAFTFQNIE